MIFKLAAHGEFHCTELQKKPQEKRKMGLVGISF